MNRRFVEEDQVGMSMIKVVEARGAIEARVRLGLDNENAYRRDFTMPQCATKPSEGACNPVADCQTVVALCK